MSLIVLVGNAGDDRTKIHDAAQTGSNLKMWIVPKTATSDDEVLFFIKGTGFIARGFLSSDPVQEKGAAGIYRANVKGVQPIEPPFSPTPEDMPAWGWLTYPRSYNTPSPEIADKLLELLKERPEKSVLPDVDDSAIEGNISQRTHCSRERDRDLVKKKKTDVLEKTGALRCEVCGFDFEAFYGDRGAGYCEAHHLVPLSENEKEVTTKLSDLAVVCSNCHRMLHRGDWISITGLKRCLRRTVVALSLILVSIYAPSPALCDETFPVGILSGREEIKAKTEDGCQVQDIRNYLVEIKPDGSFSWSGNTFASMKCKGENTTPTGCGYSGNGTISVSGNNQWMTQGTITARGPFINYDFDAWRCGRLEIVVEKKYQIDLTGAGCVRMGSRADRDTYIASSVVCNVAEGFPEFLHGILKKAGTADTFLAKSSEGKKWIKLITSKEVNEQYQQTRELEASKALEEEKRRKELDANYAASPVSQIGWKEAYEELEKVKPGEPQYAQWLGKFYGKKIQWKGEPGHTRRWSVGHGTKKFKGVQRIEIELTAPMNPPADAGIDREKMIEMKAVYGMSGLIEPRKVTFVYCADKIENFSTPTGEVTIEGMIIEPEKAWDSLALVLDKCKIVELPKK